MITTYKFRDYLMEIHDAQYTGTADDAPDDFDKWMEDLTQDELIDFAEAFAERTLVNHNNAKPTPSPFWDGNEGGALVTK